MKDSASKVDTMEAAMQWLMRLRDESMTEQDLAAWVDWYECDERHKKAFDEMQAFWHFTGELSALPDGERRIGRLRGLPMQKPPAPSRRHAFSAALAAGVTAVGLMLGWWQWSTTKNLPKEVAQTVQERRLPDGSRVQLASRSSVDVKYTDSRRLLTLESGEAHFIVKPDRNRPFIVDVDRRQVLAVGTAFNVRKAGDRVVVTVDEGVVEIHSADAGVVRAPAGHEVKWGGEVAQPVVTEVNPLRALAWRDGRLEYVDEPLAAVIADVNRYSKRRIVIRDPAAKNLAFTGTVFTGSTEEWLHALPGEFPVSLISDGGDEWILASR